MRAAWKPPKYATRAKLQRSINNLAESKVTDRVRHVFREHCGLGTFRSYSISSNPLSLEGTEKKHVYGGAPATGTFCLPVVYSKVLIQLFI